ncbi:RES domain-containing protein [Brevibacterium luteolum]|uniref:RES domain-containing protein n=2 Tax=Brevibacterium luteolum TaxID=199591 RepID=A0A2N6PH85_9MICO|nr:RES domain-containing protein [Brevibacterium luteolum]
MMAKNPKRPGHPSIRPADLRDLPSTQPLFRIHSAGGRHPIAWNGFRDFGPLQSMRWDPHPPPPSHHHGVGVAYCATDPVTTFAEVFQERRRIRIGSLRALSAWFPARDLRLLDLTGNWPTRNGASFSLFAAPKSTCRNWARGIHELSAELSLELDGLYVHSTMMPGKNVVLFSSAHSAFPIAPAISLPLDHPVIRRLAQDASHQLSWPVV